MSSTRSKHGIIYAIAAYGIWGLIPLYFKAVASVAPLEVLAQRALWSFAMLAVLVAVLGRWRELGRELRSGKLLVMLGLSTLLIAANWLAFIYAVISGQVLQASLGYFINPLVNVLLGVVFLRERLRPYQTLSITLALVGVLVLAGFVGEVPWIALTLALTFGLYGLMRKIMPVDGLVSLTVETLAMTPIALVYLGYLGVTRQGAGSSLEILGLLALERPGVHDTAAVLRGGGKAVAALDDGHPPVPLAHSPVPAGGSGVPGAVLDSPDRELRVHLDGDHRLHGRFVSGGTAGPAGLGRAVRSRP